MDRKRDKEEKGEEEEPSKKQKKTDLMLCRELVKAAERGETERVRELLHTEGADVHHADECFGTWKKTALFVACLGGHLETARMILECGGQTQEHVEDAFIAAAGVGRLEIVQMMMEKGVDASVRDSRAARWAAQQGRSDVVEFLLRDSRVDPAADDNEAVVWAAFGGHSDVLKILLKDPRVDITARDQQAICSAAYHGHVEVVKILLEDPRVDPAARDNEPVCDAAKRGHLEVLKVLLADQRVDGTRAIPEASALDLTAQGLLEDERCGIHVNRAVFEEHHPLEVKRFDELVKKRTARVCAVSWVMKQIGEGWGDVREPMEARMSAESVF